MNQLKTITPLLWRVIVFVCLFIIISGLIGPRIISGGILFRDGFWVYGGIGKAAIFSVIALVLLLRHNPRPIRLLPWRPLLFGWILAAGAVCVLGWIFIGNLLLGNREFYNLAGAHAGLLLSIALVAVGCFGPKNIWLLWQSFRREIIGALGLGIIFYIFLLGVYALWQPLAAVVLFSVNGLLGLTGLQAVLVPPNTLLFDKFGITVAEFCSGVESIALFTGLYTIVGLLDWHRLNKRRYFVVFPIALLILFTLNILRVFGLILAGYYINPEIAFSLFHTYAGLVFFIIYSAIFWAIAYKHLLKQTK